ncbi:hypothetical protein HDU96_004766 [Phlyctochytrium bullatum]|nr:hypothetical protein HDU96_004766 [Phlyctochytrium bullatum]
MSRNPPIASTTPRTTGTGVRGVVPPVVAPKPHQPPPTPTPHPHRPPLDNVSIPPKKMSPDHLNLCHSILHGLQRHADAGPFLFPMDPTDWDWATSSASSSTSTTTLPAPRAPTTRRDRSASASSDCFPTTTTPRPMDLSTVEDLLSTGRYPTPADFMRDLRLIFDNARRMWDGGEPSAAAAAAIRKHADGLEAYLEWQVARLPAAARPVFATRAEGATPPAPARVVKRRRKSDAAEDVAAPSATRDLTPPPSAVAPAPPPAKGRGRPRGSSTAPATGLVSAPASRRNSTADVGGETVEAVRMPAPPTPVPSSAALLEGVAPAPPPTGRRGSVEEVVGVVVRKRGRPRKTPVVVARVESEEVVVVATAKKEGEGVVEMPVEIPGDSLPAVEVIPVEAPRLPVEEVVSVMTETALPEPPVVAEEPPVDVEGDGDGDGDDSPHRKRQRTGSLPKKVSFLIDASEDVAGGLGDVVVGDMEEALPPLPEPMAFVMEEMPEAPPSEMDVLLSAGVGLGVPTPERGEEQEEEEDVPMAEVVRKAAEVVQEEVVQDISGDAVVAPTTTLEDTLPVSQDEDAKPTTTTTAGKTLPPALVAAANAVAEAAASGSAKKITITLPPLRHRKNSVGQAEMVASPTATSPSLPVVTPVVVATTGRTGRNRSRSAAGAEGALQATPRTSPASATGSTPTTTSSSGTPVRQCSFCGTEKTPMWRHGPAGFDPLCNGCGVKWKRGRILKGYEKRKRSTSSSPRPPAATLRGNGSGAPAPTASASPELGGAATVAGVEPPAPVFTTASGRPARAKANPQFSYPYLVPHRSASDPLLVDAHLAGFGGAGPRRKRQASGTSLSPDDVKGAPVSYIIRDFNVTLQMATSSPCPTAHLDGSRLEDLVATCRRQRMLPPADPTRPLEPRTLMGSGPRAAYLASALALIPATELAFVAAGLGRIIQGGAAMRRAQSTPPAGVAWRGAAAEGVVVKVAGEGVAGKSVPCGAAAVATTTTAAVAKVEATVVVPAEGEEVVELERDVGELSAGEWGDVCGFLLNVGA